MRMKMGTLKKIIREAVAKTINEVDVDHLSRYERSQGFSPQDAGTWEAEWDPEKNAWHFTGGDGYSRGYWSTGHHQRDDISSGRISVTNIHTGVPWTPADRPPSA